MNTEERKTFAGRIGKKQWMAIAAVLVVGLAAGALILRTAPAKPEAAGHSEAGGHADGEHHEEGKEGGKDHDHGHAEAKGHDDKEHHGEEAKEKGESKEHREDEEKIAFTDEQVKAAGMAIESAGPARIKTSLQLACLLYTSDAADE